ncbi:sodium- and chloride-dependent taurine transporter-like [Pecten maximus]|uniref:sodium- and chloride-dependent taurine transporter-like n=1 Tax=Pecten maximus TaxID=6579 RepID=UPI001458A7CB|nr:sodium- and chloride-dependent taurine transporter-like [Pecten maximus]
MSSPDERESYKLEQEHLTNGHRDHGCCPDAISSDTSGSSTESDNPKKELHQREVWSRKIDFLLACVGFSVGLGNVWRFPFLCYKNGGGAFLIPYFIAVLLGGIPTFFLEVSLGQFMSEGGVGCWRIAPLFQGIGYACAIIVFLLNCEYNIILTWSLYYLFSSFTAVLPWSHGNNEWNSPECRKLYAEKPVNSTTLNLTSVGTTVSTFVTSVVNNASFLIDNITEGTAKPQACDPVTEFWERKVLQLSDGVDHPGNIKWDLALCLLLAWIIIYFCIWKGIKSSGKVMYFTATSPYVLMFVLLIRGVTLDGAIDGIRYYLIPDWQRLQDPQVWVDAGTQIFFSYSISLGTLTALGSYNRFNHKSFRDSMGFAAVNSFTSVLAGLVIFSVLGFMAKQQGTTVDKVAESGPGLAFIAYPEAVRQMPVAPLWAVLFFAMVLLLGLDSQFVGVEGFVTAVVDGYPQHLRVGRRREIFIAIVCVICFLIGLSMVTEGGMYVFQLFDYYSASRIVLVVAFFECIVVAYIYGIDRFYDNLEMMFGFKFPNWTKVVWMFITPTFTMSIFIMGAISYSELDYKRKLVTYNYPSWAIGVGWTLAMISVIWIPIIMIKRLYDAEGTLQERFIACTTPQLKENQIRKGEDLSKIKIISNHYIKENASQQDNLLPTYASCSGSVNFDKSPTKL